MKTSITVEGLSDCEEALDALPLATSKNVLRRSLKAAAQPIADDAQRAAPKRTGRLQKSIAISTKLSKRQRKQAVKSSAVEMYIGAGPLPWAHMQEFGTAHDRPQPFLRPAVDGNISRAIDIFRTSLKSEVDKAMLRFQRKAARILAKKGSTT